MSLDVLSESFRAIPKKWGRFTKEPWALDSLTSGLSPVLHFQQQQGQSPKVQKELSESDWSRHGSKGCCNVSRRPGSRWTPNPEAIANLAPRSGCFNGSSRRFKYYAAKYTKADFPVFDFSIAVAVGKSTSSFYSRLFQYCAAAHYTKADFFQFVFSTVVVIVGKPASFCCLWDSVSFLVTTILVADVSEYRPNWCNHPTILTISEHQTDRWTRGLTPKKRSKWTRSRACRLNNHDSRETYLMMRLCSQVQPPFFLLFTTS